MDENKSRLNRFEKQRKTTKAVTILVIIGAILLLFLVGKFIFGGSGDNDKNESKAENKKEDIVITESDEENDDTEKEDTKDDEKDNKEDANKDKDKEKKEEKKKSINSSDSNVSEAYTADWDPVKTKQEGEHTTQFKKESQDWEEMKKAAGKATELHPDTMITWMIENGGAPDKTIATISDSNETNVYRVYLTWIDHKGWQPQKVEKLKQNDKK